MQEYLIVCPNATKMSLLHKIYRERQKISVKFMSIEDFLDSYFYTYDYQAISFIMHKYNVTLSISKMYLQNLYFIDCNKKYRNKKLLFLQQLKMELVENHLLTFHNEFKMYLKKKSIYVLNYPRLEKYLVDLFQELHAEVVSRMPLEKDFTVFSFRNMYDEIYFVIEHIIELVRKGVSLNQITLLNVSEEYYYTIKILFEVFHIPISLSTTHSIKTSLLVKRYLQSKELPEITEDNFELVNQIVAIKNQLVYLEDDINYDACFLDVLDHTMLKGERCKDSVQVSNLFERDYSEDEYVFLIGFNDQKIPILYKNEDYITDAIKDEVSLYTTKEKNKRERENTFIYLSNIKNLFISYKQSSFKDKFYPSSMIKDYNMKVVEKMVDNFNLSHAFNKRMLSIYLDQYYKYKEKNQFLFPLYITYKDQLLYNTYTHIFTGINRDRFLSSVTKIGLSYTSMNAYNLCGFKYYVNYILKVDPFLSNFSTFIGDLFHFVLEKCFLDHFVFDEVWNSYLEGKELLVKDGFFLEKMKKILEEVIGVLKEQRYYTSLKDGYYEKSISIPLKCNEVEAYFSGKIDKILYKSDGSRDLYAVVDYKTGSFDASLYNMKYGIGMQLATYLYLIERSSVFKNGVFGGMYFQSVLPKSFRYDGKKSYIEKLEEHLKLVGYSTDVEEVLCEVDHEYTNSRMIKGMRTTSKGFSMYARLLSETEVKLMHDYTEKVIYKTLSSILHQDFSIHPIRIDRDLVSCKYCKYRDLCFYKEEDIIDFEKNTSLDFLGGDFCGK